MNRKLRIAISLLILYLVLFVPISIGLMSEGKDFISIFIAFNGCIVAAIILIGRLFTLLKWID